MLWSSFPSLITPPASSCDICFTPLLSRVHFWLHPWAFPLLFYFFWDDSSCTYSASCWAGCLVYWSSWSKIERTVLPFDTQAWRNNWIILILYHHSTFAWGVVLGFCLRRGQRNSRDAEFASFPTHLRDVEQNSPFIPSTVINSFSFKPTFPTF